MYIGGTRLYKSIMYWSPIKLWGGGRTSTPSLVKSYATFFLVLYTYLFPFAGVNYQNRSGWEKKNQINVFSFLYNSGGDGLKILSITEARKGNRKEIKKWWMGRIKLLRWKWGLKDKIPHLYHHGYQANLYVFVPLFGEAKTYTDIICFVLCPRESSGCYQVQTTVKVSWSPFHVIHVCCMN